MSENWDNYKDLALAIVEKASEDYIAELTCKYPNKGKIQELEEFFMGNWFTVLCWEIDGEDYMKKIREKLKVRSKS